MTHNTPPMGRPSSRIDGARLKALRTEAGYTQLALAQKVYAAAGKATASNDVMKASAGRWEREGRVQIGMVMHLADALRTTPPVLQGERPDPAPQRISEFENHLHALISNGPSAALVEALEQYQEDALPVQELATDITNRLEAAQLSQDQQEFKALAALTGLSTRELSHPVSHEGFWMFIGSGVPGPQKTEILRGVHSVLAEVRTELRNFLEHLHESDAHVAFRQEGHWFRVTLHHARVSQWTRTLRFSRFQPNERGLQWVSSTWLDKFWLDQMPQDADGLANFVTGFDGIRVPADCTRLRFAITQNPGQEEFEKRGMDAPQQIVALTAGDLAELPPETLASFTQEGSAHDRVVDRLAANLWETLQPWMVQWPPECWSFQRAVAHIDVFLEVPLRLWANCTVPPRGGRRLSLLLVEQLADGTAKPAPWRHQSVAIVVERLEIERQAAMQTQTQTQSRPQPPAA